MQKKCNNSAVNFNKNNGLGNVVATERQTEVFTDAVTLNRNCRHCNTAFQAKRSTAKYCSTACRVAYSRKNKQLSDAKKEARKREKIDNKIRKLARSSYGRWLAASLRRSGTVQVLEGATVSDLESLAALKHQCTRFSGYTDGKPTGCYELSHIYPANGKVIGKLFAANLVVSPVAYNRKRGKRMPAEVDDALYVPRDILRRCYRVDANDSPYSVFKKVQRLLGKEFDHWLKSYQIKASQREQLQKKLAEVNPEIELSFLTLDELKLLAVEYEVPYFKANYTPEEQGEVLCKELERHGYQHSVLYEVLRRYCDAEFSIEYNLQLPASLPENFLEFLCTQALNKLHREDYALFLDGIHILDHLPAPTKWENRTVEVTEDYDDIL